MRRGHGHVVGADGRPARSIRVALSADMVARLNEAARACGISQAAAARAFIVGGARAVLSRQGAAK